MIQPVELGLLALPVALGAFLLIAVIVALITHLLLNRD